MLNEHSELEIQIRHDQSRAITEAVINFTLDFGLVVGPVRHPDLVARQIVEADVTFWATQRVVNQWLSEKIEPVLFYLPDSGTSDWFHRELKKKKIHFRREIGSTDLEVIAHLISAGAGVGVLPNWYDSLFKLSKVVRVPHLPILKDSVSLIYRHDLHKNAAARKIASCIEQYTHW